MKASVLEEANRLRARDIPEPVLKLDEILIKVEQIRYHSAPLRYMSPGGKSPAPKTFTMGIRLADNGVRHPVQSSIVTRHADLFHPIET